MEMVDFLVPMVVAFVPYSTPRLPALASNLYGLRCTSQMSLGGNEKVLLLLLILNFCCFYSTEFCLSLITMHIHVLFILLDYATNCRR
jgi:hypothetical protein